MSNQAAGETGDGEDASAHNAPLIEIRRSAATLVCIARAFHSSEQFGATELTATVTRRDRVRFRHYALHQRCANIEARRRVGSERTFVQPELLSLFARKQRQRFGLETVSGWASRITRMNRGSAFTGSKSGARA